MNTRVLIEKEERPGHTCKYCGERGVTMIVYSKGAIIEIKKRTCSDPRCIEAARKEIWGAIRAREMLRKS